MRENIEIFIDEFRRSFAEGTFVKATLGNYKSSDPHLQKINIRPVETRKGKRLLLLYKYDTRDTARNYEPDEAIGLIAGMLGTEFFSGHLFTTACDLQLELSRRGRSRLNRARPTFREAPTTQHDRAKTTLVDKNAPYLRALGVTNDHGNVRDKQQDKWRQIVKFVEVLASLIEKSPLKEARTLRIADMGSGKGYLTFAAYDHLANTCGINVSMTGIDARPELIDLCNAVSAACGYEGLSFVTGDIRETETGAVDILIALHACDTATDDAIFKGIRGGATLIVAAPCCHKEIRRQIAPPEFLRGVLRHGVLMERTAETLTDGLRSLLLEREGYRTKLFEFVATEHTPKNNLLVGTLAGPAPDRERVDEEIRRIEEMFGIGSQHLASLLDS